MGIDGGSSGGGGGGAYGGTTSGMYVLFYSRSLLLHVGSFFFLITDFHL